MPVLTDVQGYAAELMRALLCVRRDKIHWMIGRKYPFVAPEKIMRQLCHILRIYDDGEYYRWPGTESDPMRAAAVDVMLILCQGSLPILGAAVHDVPEEAAPPAARKSRATSPAHEDAPETAAPDTASAPQSL